jgi:hypothetical protein
MSNICSEIALSKILTGPPTNLTPLSFPSQNQRYTEERDIPRRPATSLGLSSLSGVMLILLAFVLPSLSRIVAPAGTNVPGCHKSLAATLFGMPSDPRPHPSPDRILSGFARKPPLPWPLPFGPWSAAEEKPGPGLLFFVAIALQLLNNVCH